MLKIYSLLLFLFLQTSVYGAGSVLVTKVSITGYSFVDPEGPVVYGGIAGTACTGDGVSTCNSCTDKTTLQACNQTSVYPAQQISISFQISQDLTTAAVAKLFIEQSNAGIYDQVLSTTVPAGTKTVNFQTTWAEICNRTGTVLPANCVGPAAAVISKNVAFGIDSNATNEVEVDERKIVAFKLHYIPPASTVSQSFCPTKTGATGFGVCNLELASGDKKAFIKSAITLGTDTFFGTTIAWDSIAIFAIPTANDATSEAAAYTGFKSGTVAPIIRSIAADGSIPDSQLTGGLSNYTHYCFVYGNKNKAQNIYRFVTDAAAAPKGCVTLSENVGLLEDKHCFISTAAFGSEMASEVQTFRQFRNQFLLSNDLGKYFVKLYYRLSPPVATTISHNEVLRTLTRAILYPFLGFSYVALNYGILVAILSLMIFLILIFQIKKIVKQKVLLFFLIILIFAPTLKAQVQPATQTIQHSESTHGLVRIKKDGTYIYEIKRPLKKESSRISFGNGQAPDISIDIESTTPSGQPSGIFKTFTYDNFYGGSSNFIIGYDYEYFPWMNNGKLGFQAGVSMMFAQGHGRQKATLTPSEEKYTLFTLPLDLGAVYRLEWKDKQLFAPYAAGGGVYTVLLEKREDKTNLSYAGAPGFYAAGGVLINLGLLDEASGFALDSEYGIGNLWLSVEYRIVEVDSNSFKYSNRYINAGVSFDF